MRPTTKPPGKLSRALLFGVVAFYFSSIPNAATKTLEISDYTRYRHELELELCTFHVGKVEAIVPDASGATIRYRSSQSDEHSQFSNKRPNPAATVYEIPLSMSNPPKVWSWRSNTPKSLDLHWSKADGPVPLAPGMEAWIYVDPSGQLRDISYVAGISHWRKGKDGFVELVLCCATLSKPSRSQLIYVRPAGMDASGNNIHWTRKWGLLITIDGLGPASFEVEEAVLKRPALKLANAPEMEIVPGRDGWKALPNIDQSGDKEPTAAQAKAWDELSNAIPKAQYMKPAG